MSSKGSPQSGKSRRSPSAPRSAAVERDTKETQIRLNLNLDGTGIFEGETGIAFFDHMLHLFAKHGRFDLRLKMKGDLDVECHHSVEDVGIALGQALAEAAGDKAGMRRFGHATVPMEESLVTVSLDFCGRAYLHWGFPEFRRQMIGNYATEMTEDFFRAVTAHAGITMHVERPRGRNAHHVIEAAFKAFARALRESVTRDASGEIPSTKGLL